MLYIYILQSYGPSGQLTVAHWQENQSLHPTKQSSPVTQTKLAFWHCLKPQPNDDPLQMDICDILYPKINNNTLAVYILRLNVTNNQILCNELIIKRAKFVFNADKNNILLCEILN